MKEKEQNTQKPRKTFFLFANAKGKLWRGKSSRPARIEFLVVLCTFFLCMHRFCERKMPEAILPHLQNCWKQKHQTICYAIKSVNGNADLCGVFDMCSIHPPPYLYVPPATDDIFASRIRMVCGQFVYKQAKFQHSDKCFLCVCMVISLTWQWAFNVTMFCSARNWLQVYSSEHISYVKCLYSSDKILVCCVPLGNFALFVQLSPSFFLSLRSGSLCQCMPNSIFAQHFPCDSRRNR